MNAPANETQLAGLEFRLKKTLPNEYRDLLLCSNGLLINDFTINLFSSLANARVTARSLGGDVFNENWNGPGFIVCNAMDPEGNIFQVREIAV